MLLEQLNVLLGFAFVWAEQEQVGFPRTLSIGHHDFRCNHRRHDEYPPFMALRCGLPSTFALL